MLVIVKGSITLTRNIAIIAQEFADLFPARWVIATFSSNKNDPQTNQRSVGRSLKPARWFRWIKWTSLGCLAVGVSGSALFDEGSAAAAPCPRHNCVVLCGGCDDCIDEAFARFHDFGPRFVCFVGGVCPCLRMNMPGQSGLILTI